ncbi:MAG: TrkH family potassium uptake protein [Alphaproteobacteria bacterium]|nr:TrkH family potassium uptake protein [Alphaproteobacteria bacterium]MCD8570937.1 TrkH family potassium uptake protein [Alphaproteobacteria bacterium]
MNYQVIGFTIGSILAILGIFQLFPALLDYYDGHRNAQIFYFCGVVSLFFGGALVIANKNFKMDVTIRQAFLLTTLSWIFMATFSALPIYIANPKLDYAKSFFEGMSAITTTGSTVLVGLDDMSRGLLLWRSILQMIGGLGIIAFAIVLLPHLKIGGMHLFKTETSDRSDKPVARTTTLVRMLVYVYLFLMGLCMLAYKVLGMSWFDAMNHAMTTVSTGGFSTHDASFGHFGSVAMEVTCMIFMLCGGIPFILYVYALYGRWQNILADEQVKGLLAMLAVFISVLTVWLWLNSEYSIYQSLRYVSFNVISLITTTGYATTDYNPWGPFASMCILFITYLGACAGSTSGGIKTMRLIIVGRVLRKHLKNLIYPNGVFIANYQGRAVSDEEGLNIMGFLGLFVALNVLLTLLLTMTGVDLMTAISGAATATANVGPGLGAVIGPAGNFATLNDTALWLLSLGMLLGRLEILTVAVILSMRFWKG